MVLGFCCAFVLVWFAGVSCCLVLIVLVAFILFVILDMVLQLWILSFLVDFCVLGFGVATDCCV